MKLRILINFFLTVLSAISVAQTTDTLFFVDGPLIELKIASEKDHHTYYRVIQSDSTGIFHLTDYRKSGDVQMTGQCSALNPDMREGEFVWYYKNGKAQQIIKYENGKINDQIEYYEPSGELQIKYCPSIHYLDNFSELRIDTIDFRNYIHKKLKYPRKARRKGIEGVVETILFISPKGKVEHCFIYKSVDEYLDKEARRVVLSGFKFNSPVFQQEKTFVQLFFPIDFTL